MNDLCLLLRLPAALDEAATHTLRRELARSLGEGLRLVILDARDTVSINTSGCAFLDALDEHLRSQGGGMLLVKESADVLRRLRIAGLERLVHVRSAMQPPEAVADSTGEATVIDLQERRAGARRDRSGPGPRITG